jgi:hypothetical protein
MMSALFMDKGSNGSSGGAFAMRPKFNRNLVGTEDGDEEQGVKYGVIQIEA